MTNIVKTSVLPNAPKKTVSRVVDKSRFMKRAHAVARTYEGDYIACLALAMRKLYASIGGPKLVASYKAEEDKLGLAIEVVSIMNDNRTWSHTKVVHEPINIHGRPTRFTKEIHNKARALNNGIKHLKLEYERKFNKLGNAVKVSLIQGPKQVLANKMANDLMKECNELLLDIKIAEAFVPRNVHCDVPRNKVLDTRARNFSDMLMGTYDEIDSSGIARFAKVAV